MNISKMIETTLFFLSDLDQATGLKAAYIFKTFRVKSSLAATY